MLDVSMLKNKTDEEKFYFLLDKMKEIHDAKRHDYASDEDRFSNLMLSEMAGIPAWKGCLVRMSDKFSRLTEFAKKGEFEVKDENVEDTFMDMANYSIIGLILYLRMKDGLKSSEPNRLAMATEVAEGEPIPKTKAKATAKKVL